MKPDDSRRVYDGKLFAVTVERWGEHEREIVDHPGAAGRDRGREDSRRAAAVSVQKVG